ncbi:MAG: LamG domain-containing protein, partial [Patescibacteria group bacterium]|nr:LamG domain-containing protein [Patescibacteria group bacterium]
MSSRRVLAVLRVVLIASTAPPLIAAIAWAQPADEPRQLAEPFRSEYAGEDATGEHVIALWQFNGPEPAADLSGNGHGLTLNGAEFVEGGRFGGALRSYRGWPAEDKPHQARAKNHPNLTPAGAFTIEMWIQPADALRGYPEAFLVDKKYVADHDYQLVLLPESAPDMRQLRMSLGFGSESAMWLSDLVHVLPGQWRHVAFTYDGEGTGAFFVDGSLAGSERKTGYGRIAAGRHDLVLGDRIGSYYHGFPGLMDQVRVTRGAREFTPLKFQLASPRRVFERMEQAELLRFTVT